MTDEELLLAKAAGGDNGELVKLHDRWRGWVLADFLRLAGEKEGEDLAQHFWLCLPNKAKSFRGGSARAWARRVAMNIFLDWLDAPPQEKAAVTESLEVKLEVQGDGSWLKNEHERRPDEDLMAREFRERVAMATDKLRPNHALVLSLREIEKCSFQEVAAQMSVTVAAAKLLAGRARKAARKMPIFSELIEELRKSSRREGGGGGPMIGEAAFGD